MNNILATKKIRKYLRNNMTKEEIILWSILKDKSIFDLKFRRQHSIGYYILDFYCPKVKLCIELDGYYHYHEYQIEKDSERDMKLRNAGIHVLRIENKEIRENIKDVIENIKLTISSLPKKKYII